MRASGLALLFFISVGYTVRFSIMILSKLKAVRCFPNTSKEVPLRRVTLIQEYLEPDSCRGIFVVLR
jgi:hypothetical protein